jgi:hypothetical protein
MSTEVSCPNCIRGTAVLAPWNQDHLVCVACGWTVVGVEPGNGVLRPHEVPCARCGGPSRAQRECGGLFCQVCAVWTWACGDKKCQVCVDDQPETQRTRVA